MLKNENSNLQTSLKVSKAEKDGIVEQITELKNNHRLGLASKDEMLKVFKDQSKSHLDTIANLENVRPTSNKTQISIDSAKQKSINTEKFRQQKEAKNHQESQKNYSEIQGQHAHYAKENQQFYFMNQLCIILFSPCFFIEL